jgi:hypothetical protein
MIDPEKVELIAEIERLDKYSTMIDLDKYSKEELQFHLTQLKKKRRL